MGLLVKGCCCLSLETAGLIHGWIGIMFFSFAITSTISNINNINSYEVVSMKNVHDDSYNLTTNYNQEKISLVLLGSCFDMLISVLLIAGITKKKYMLLVPWLILRALQLIIVIPIYLLFVAFTLYTSQSALFTMALIYSCIIGLFIWSYIVIYSLYKEICNTSIDVEQSTPSTLPNCESQSRPDDPPPPYHLFAK